MQRRAGDRPGQRKGATSKCTLLCKKPLKILPVYGRWATGRIGAVKSSEIRLLDSVVDTLSVVETIYARLWAQSAVAFYMEEGAIWALQEHLREAQTDNNDLKVF